MTLTEAMEQVERSPDGRICLLCGKALRKHMVQYWTHSWRTEGNATFLLRRFCNVQCSGTYRRLSRLEPDMKGAIALHGQLVCRERAPDYLARARIQKELNAIEDLIARVRIATRKPGKQKREERGGRHG